VPDRRPAAASQNAQSFGAHHYFSNVALLVLQYLISALPLENQNSQLYWKM
jgi:hypothetical protein